MADLLNPLAADAAAAGLIAPTWDTLPALLRDWTGQKPLLVCSGGTTTRCAAPGHWTLDMRPGFQEMELGEQGAIRIAAGCRMSSVLDHLAARGRTVGAGLSCLPGVGYVLTGGVGPLSRSHGLAIDQLTQIEGVWGNGESFNLRPSVDREWRGLCGAAPFLAVITHVTLATWPLAPLWIRQDTIELTELPVWIAEAEAWPNSRSLQWSWRYNATVDLLQVSEEPFQGSHAIDGQHQLPPLGGQSANDTRIHSEVLGLLGPAAAPRWREVLPELTALMRERPHPSCSLAGQQLGGQTGRVGWQASAFIHRDAVWKPWITAAWAAGDADQRQSSLGWLQKVWSLLSPICPGVHLAQLHEHLPWHKRVLQQAFGAYLPELRTLKRERDPAGNLPSL